MAKTRQHLSLLLILCVPQLLQGVCGYTEHADRGTSNRKRNVEARTEYDEYVDYVDQANEGDLYSTKYQEENEDDFRRGKFRNENSRRNGRGNFEGERSGVVFVLENSTHNFRRNDNNIRDSTNLVKNHNDQAKEELSSHRRGNYRTNHRMVDEMVRKSEEMENNNGYVRNKNYYDSGEDMERNMAKNHNEQGKRNRKELGVRRKGFDGHSRNRIMDQKNDEAEDKGNFRRKTYDNIRNRNVDYNDERTEKELGVHRKGRKNRLMAGKVDQTSDVIQDRNNGNLRDTNNQGTGGENIALQAKKIHTNGTDQLCSPSNTTIIVGKCPGKKEHRRKYRNCSTIFMLNEENPCSFFMCKPSQNVRIFMEPQLMECPPDTYFDTELMRCERLIDADVYIVCPNTTVPLNATEPLK